jgi:hypothetical protein
VGCTSKHRAVADVSAVGDPYTGAAVYDSTGECEYAEGGKIRKGPWCTIGGTSLASPIIASVFALAGGANRVAYPAKTLYENLPVSSGSLHDVVAGSNGECGDPFDEEEGPDLGVSGCEASTEAGQCSGKAICLAGKGYDGPSGVGTPDGIVAFQPLGEEAKKKAEEQKAKEKKAEETRAEEQRRKEEAEAAKPTESAGGLSGPSAGGNPSAPTPIGVAPATGVAPAIALPAPPISSTLVPTLSALALTRTATAALSRPRLNASRLAFAFTLNTPARVRVTLAKQIKVHGHTHWLTLPDTLTIAAAKGRDNAHLSARATLAPGRYRLTLIPAHGTARTLTFQIGD